LSLESPSEHPQTALAHIRRLESIVKDPYFKTNADSVALKLLLESGDYADAQPLLKAEEKTDPNSAAGVYRARPIGLGRRGSTA